ncbi:N-terminal domain of peptidoglycan hydrolase CwlO-containing protein [Dyadobacter soli]|uniref:N-terminal domain of peptidoglycan hydrolase CwlO-containing protein n=1 Tax=Dyadobacter soli TaxID=659014 RepID=A0A1G7P4R9_9BACT|nr:hypothetical protein [Dyadobacter soli]SDF81263.1 N-terminal domain of peptidoglycan hydrolase CwlO-containing protein [Dyadobacter soli]
MKSLKIFLVVFTFISFTRVFGQNKIVEIETTFDFDMRLIPNRSESLTFRVIYSNQLKKNKAYNYEVTFKSNSDTKFKKDTVRLKYPIDLESIKKEFNKAMQIKNENENDEVIYTVSDNSIYDIAYILDTIPYPIASKTISGNLVLNSYIKVFNEKSKLDDHRLRQDSIHHFTQPLVEMMLSLDKLSAQKIDFDKEIKENLAQQDTGKVSIDKKRSDLSLKLAQDSLALKNANENIKRSTKRENDVRSSTRNFQEEQEILKNRLRIVNNYLSLTNTLPIDTVLNNALVNEFIAYRDTVSKFISKVKSLSPLTENGVLPAEEKFDVTKILETEKSAKTDSLKQLIDITEKSKYNQIKLENDISIWTKKKENIEDTIRTTKSQLTLNELLQNRNSSKNLDSINKILTRKILVIDSTKSKLSHSIADLTSEIKSKNIFQINKLSIQIERGFVERIQVYVPSQNSDKYNIFENIFAIGFSSVKNFKQFTKTRLYSRLTDEYIYLSDVIANFDNLLENYTRDYSPADTTINHFKPKEGFIRLNRDQFMNLFDARVYTDLMGISDSKPNGLVQIEVARKFNIQTSRRQFTGARSDWGAVSYLNVFGSINKIENNKKHLPLRNENIGSNGQLISPYYATNLDFRLYQNLSLGAEMNLFLLDWPDGKLTAYFDVGLGYGQTPLVYNKRTVVGNAVSQSERDSSLIAHSSSAYPKFTLEIFSEKRIRVNMSYQFNSTRIYSNNNFKAIASYAKSDLIDRVTEPYARKSHMIEFNLIASPTSTQYGRFFFRARYFLQHRDHNTFFSQIQFGYTYSLRLKKFEL